MSPFSFTGVLTVFRHITLGIPQFRFANKSRSVSQTPDKIQWTSIKRLYRNWIRAYIVLSYVTLVKASRQWEKPELPSPVRLQTKKKSQYQSNYVPEATRTHGLPREKSCIVCLNHDSQSEQQTWHNREYVETLGCQMCAYIFFSWWEMCIS